MTRSLSRWVTMLAPAMHQVSYLEPSICTVLQQVQEQAAWFRNLAASQFTLTWHQHAFTMPRAL
jgi:hypothetical protein